MLQYRNPKANIRDNVRVGTVTTIAVLFDRRAPIPDYLCTNSSRNLADAFYSQPRDKHFERRLPTWVDLCVKIALLPSRPSGQLKCTYWDDTIRLSSIEDEKVSLDWLKLPAAIQCTSWSAWTVSELHNSADSTKMSMMTPQAIWNSDNQSSPTLVMIFDCNYIHDNVAINKWNANDHMPPSKKRERLAAQAVMMTFVENDNSMSIRHIESTRYKFQTELARSNSDVLYSTVAHPVSVGNPTNASERTGNNTSGRTHHPSHNDRKCNATCNGQPEYLYHSQLLGLPYTGRQIRSVGHANVCIQMSRWHTLDPQTKSWYRQVTIDCLQSPRASGATEITLMTTAVASKVLEDKDDNLKTSFWGTIQVYRHLEQPH